MYLFFDTETTGLPKNWNAPAHDTKNWPRMIQIAFLRCNDSGKVLGNGSYIIKPEGFEIPDKVVEIHGITTQKAKKEGIALAKALEKFSGHLEDSEVLVSHNMRFDAKVVGAEFHRKGFDNEMEILEQINKICTMTSSTTFCKIPGPCGYKWPKLEELHKKLFRRSFADGHDSMRDTEACAKCFFKLKEMGVIKE